MLSMVTSELVLASLSTDSERSSELCCELSSELSSSLGSLCSLEHFSLGIQRAEWVGVCELGDRWAPG